MKNGVPKLSEERSPGDVPLIDGFKLIKKYGENSVASLWKARQVSLKRTVVVKILSEHLSRDPEYVKQFQSEAKVAAKLKHMGIVQIYDFGQAKQSGRYYFVMEHIAGYSVGDWMRRKGKLSEADALVICHSVADALGYAWTQSEIIHADVKPDNLMVDLDGTIKITDLGLARVAHSFGIQHGDDAKPDLVGTPNFMSPEQAMGKKNLDCRSDIYSLGASLYYVLTGTLPFGRCDATEVLRRQVNEKLDNPKKLVPGISQGFNGLIMKMMAKNPEDRHQNWPEVIKDMVRAEKAPGSRKSPSARIDFSAQTMSFPELAEVNMITCPHCSRQVKDNTKICPFCSKPLDRPDVSAKPRLKGKPVASRKPNATPKLRSGTPKAVMPEMLPRRKSSLFENVRLIASLALISFLFYYGYQRVQRDRDILEPVRTKIRMRIIPAARSGIENMLNYLPAQFSDMMTDKAAQEMEQHNAEMLELLDECQDQAFRAGDAVSIDLKGQDNPVEGIIERVGISGVIIRVGDETVVCPFAMMEENSRLMFFPEERARALFEQRKDQEESEE